MKSCIFAALFIYTKYNFVICIIMSDFKETCIWMSYRYAIGRKTIAAVTHARDIAMHLDWIPENRREFTAEDILRTINGQTNWLFKNIKVIGVEARYDVFSIIFEWFYNNPQEDMEKYFMEHIWYVDLKTGEVYKIESRTDAPQRTAYGNYTDSTIFNEYHDYLPWIKLVKFIKGATHEVTLNSTKEIISATRWIDIVHVGENKEIKIKYSKATEYPEWYISPEYITKINKL